MEFQISSTFSSIFVYETICLAHLFLNKRPKVLNGYRGPIENLPLMLKKVLLDAIRTAALFFFGHETWKKLFFRCTFVSERDNLCSLVYSDTLQAISAVSLNRVTTHDGLSIS